MSLATLQRSSCSRFAACRASAAPRPAVGISRRAAVSVVAFREDAKSKAQSAKQNAKQTAKRLTKQATSSSTKGNKQRAVLPPNAPRNEKENAESVVLFLAVASLFLTGVLFVFPALLGGAPATTKPIQQGINKTFNIKEPADISGPGYAPGPGPAAAPGTPATRM